MTVRVTTPERVLFPSIGFTKRDLVDYYVRVADRLLPHVAGRPMTLHRFPGGVEGPSFYQTRAPSHPPWIRVQRMVFRSAKDVDAVVLGDADGLVWAANLSAIELHPYLVRAERLDEPTELVVDLDPGRPATIVDAAAVALVVRDALALSGVATYVKVTGGLGLHVVAPLAPGHSFAQTKGVVRQLARDLARAAPDRVTDVMARDRRPGRVFVDWSQNDPGKSNVAPFSLRGGHIPTVAAPVSWDRVEAAVVERDHRHLVFTPEDAAACEDISASIPPQRLSSSATPGNS